MSKADRRARKQENKKYAQEQRHAAWRRYRRRRLGARIIAVALVAGLVATGALFIFADDDDSAPDLTTTTVGETTTTTLPAELAAVECSEDVPDAAGEEKPSFDTAPDTVIQEGVAYRATIETTCGTIVADLDPSAQGVSFAGVNNFVFLAREGFFDGLTFHRVVDGFVIQGGDPAADGTGGPGYSFGSADDIPADLAYEIGDLVYANSGSDPSTSGSQIFVVTGPNGAALPPQFIKFGSIVEGLDVAQRLEKFAIPGTEAPSQPLYIFSVTIEEA